MSASRRRPPFRAACDARGATLVELVIVISIVGILANIAVSGYLFAKLRAQEAGLKTLVNTIKKELDTWAGDYDTAHVWGTSPKKGPALSFLNERLMTALEGGTVGGNVIGHRNPASKKALILNARSLAAKYAQPAVWMTNQTAYAYDKINRRKSYPNLAGTIVVEFANGDPDADIYYVDLLGRVGKMRLNSRIGGN